MTKSRLKAGIDGTEVAVTPFSSIGAGGPRELFVAPDGTGGGDGSKGNPLSLAAALGATSPARAGDTIWLAGGTYAGRFRSLIQGAADAPITVRAAPGQRVTIEGSLTVGVSKRAVAGWVHFRDLEVTSSQGNRKSGQAGSFPKDIPIATGIDLFAPGSKVINCVIHDVVGNGVGVWRSAVDAEVYGCLIYNNGWRGPDRGHGHGIYSQSERGTQLLRENIVFQNLADGISPHGSGRMRGWRIEGNIVFRDTLNVGFYDTLDDVWLINNRVDGGIRLLLNRGVTGTVLRGNYVTQNLQLQVGKDLVCEENVAKGVKLTVPSLPLTPYHFDGNVYHGGPLSLTDPNGSVGMKFAQWQARGFDSGGSYFGTPTGVDVFVHPNAYQPGRGHVVVFNWAMQPSVDVDASSILRTGQAFEVRDAENYWGSPVARGTYNGALRLPMAPGEVAGRKGNLGAPAHTGVEFGAFVVVGKQ